MKKLLRAVTKKECPWLDEDLKKGMEVYIYHGVTYGCVQPTGIAVTKKPDETPFFEVPRDAIDKDDPMIKFRVN